MREHKYRLWDEICKRYWYVGFAISYDGEVYGLSQEIADARRAAGKPIRESLKDSCKHFIIEQFTGLHDKNGKEIYEGDILKYSIDGCEQKRSPYVIKDMVEWFEKMWDADSYYRWDNDMEIIGNIHDKEQ